MYTQRDVIVCVFPPSQPTLWQTSLYVVLHSSLYSSLHSTWRHMVYFNFSLEEQITILIYCCYLILSLALGLDDLLADLPCVRDTGLHIIISGISFFNNYFQCV